MVDVVCVARVSLFFFLSIDNTIVFGLQILTTQQPETGFKLVAQGHIGMQTKTCHNNNIYYYDIVGKQTYVTIMDSAVVAFW